MLKVIILLIFFSLSILKIHALERKNVNHQSIESKNAFEIFTKCAYNNINACNELLKLGIRNINECEINECEIIGLVLSKANKDKEAIPYLKKACSMQKINSCKVLGLIYESINDFKNARAYYNDACNLNNVISCHNLGILYVKLDMDKMALESFQKSCTLFYAKSCFNVAILHTKNNDNSNAKFYFDKSCDLGLNAGCQKLKNLSKVPMPKLQKVRGLYVNQF